MKFRSLGRTGLNVSVIGLGTNNFGSRMNADESIKVVHHALHSGINFIDTSNSYGGTLSEEYIGRALQDRRYDAVIATKVGSRLVEGVNRNGLGRAHIMREIDESLRRLRTDHVDLYQTHWTDVQTPLEETLRTLDDLVRSGKVRYIGCSNVAAWHMCEGVMASRMHGLTTYASVQPQFSMLFRAAEAELVPACERFGVGILPYYPLASGFLTGKYRRGKDAPIGARLAQSDRGMLTEHNFDLLEKLEKFAADRGRTVLDLAFAYLLAFPAVSSVIAGATRAEQIDANASANDWSLTEEDMSQLTQLLDTVSKPSTVERMLQD